ncbi:MAG: formylglycine-generating enzyme family protein [Muribaculaceae bacterium]
MELKSLSYKNLRNTSLGMVFKSVMMVVLLSVVSFSATGQDMIIRSFEARPFDVSASMHKRYDLNNRQPCALVKVLLVASGAAFEGNVIGEVEYKVSEYWVYMSMDSRRIVVKFPNYLPVMVEFADYGIKGLESSKTYELVVELPVYAVSPVPTVNQGQQTPAEQISNTALQAENSVQQTGNTVHQAEMSAQQTGHQSDPSIERFEVNGVTFEMVYVPGGTFTMGGTAEQGSEADDNEKPTHSVTLSGYYIGKYEVTQKQWKAIMEYIPRFIDRGENLPVKDVSWIDCREFIRKLNQLTGKKFSLPTEAQWEYAARGGKSGGTKYSGSDNIGDVAWYCDNSARKIHRVGMKNPNSLGIYDMSGNVKEWCMDKYDKDYYRNSPAINPKGPDSGSSRVYRGGGSDDVFATFCRVSYRGSCTPEMRRLGIGFRLCLQEQQDEEPVTDELNNISTNIEKIEANGVEFEMVKVPGGTFTMGGTAEQGSEADDDEIEIHSVTLSGYYIGKYEVTQAQWKAIMGNNPSWFKGDNLPVENVSWDDCQTFIRKLNQLTGKKFSLPTEAQWEYAARGGKSGGTKYSGSNTIEDVAWYDGNRGTHPVGTMDANSLGIYDMSGNVYELCQDWYGYYSSASQTNPTGPDSGSFRVYRGGSWYDFARYCRVSNRCNCAPDEKSKDIGFRLCLER